jgi:hypothetical protein
LPIDGLKIDHWKAAPEGGLLFCPRVREEAALSSGFPIVNRQSLDRRSPIANSSIGNRQSGNRK